MVSIASIQYRAFINYYLREQKTHRKRTGENFHIVPSAVRRQVLTAQLSTRSFDTRSLFYSAKRLLLLKITEVGYAQSEILLELDNKLSCVNGST